MKKLLLFSSCLLLFTSISSAQTIAQWTFETSVPTTGGPLAPEFGLGSVTSNTGGTFSNPAGFGSQESWSSNGWNALEFFQFQVSTTGLSGISVNWAQTSSNTGPSSFSLSYGTNGTTFTSFGTYSVTNDGWDTTVTPTESLKGFDLSAVTSINNQATVFFRLINLNDTAVNGSPISGSGSGRVDNFTVSAIPEPGTIALVGLGLVGILYGARRRKA